VGNTLKEKVVKRAIKGVLPDDLHPEKLDELFDLVKAQVEYW
jgi:type I restriction enzyme R subunit